MSEGRAGVASDGGRGAESVVQCLRRGASCSHVPRQGGHAKGLQVWQDLASRQPLRRARAGGGGEPTDGGALWLDPSGLCAQAWPRGAAGQKAGGGGVPSSWVANTGFGRRPLPSLLPARRMREASSRPKREYKPKPREPFDLGEPEQSNGGFPCATAPKITGKERGGGRPPVGCPPKPQSQAPPRVFNPLCALCVSSFVFLPIF